MISKIIFSLSAISGVGIFLMLTQTSPNEVGPLGVLGFFAMVYLLFLGLIAAFMYGVYRIFSLFLASFRKGQPVAVRQIQNAAFFLKYSSALAFVPIAVIAKQSTGGVGIFDIILLIIVEIIAIIYISKS